MQSTDMQQPILARQKYDPLLGPEDMLDAMQYLLEHRLGVGDRVADHAQDFRRGLLLLQRLFDVARARLHLVEQAGVLDRDHRLIGESLQERDLTFGERRDFGAAEPDDADGLAVAHQRHRENRSPT